jgi:hypothetical protein
MKDSAWYQFFDDKAKKQITDGIKQTEGYKEEV